MDTSTTVLILFFFLSLIFLIINIFKRKKELHSYSAKLKEHQKFIEKICSQLSDLKIERNTLIKMHEKELTTVIETSRVKNNIIRSKNHTLELKKMNLQKNMVQLSTPKNTLLNFLMKQKKMRPLNEI